MSSKVDTESLVCGSSLAESEHFERFNEKKTTNATAATASSNQQMIEENEHNKPTFSYTSVDDLRQQLAQDVVHGGNGQSYTTFASPFLVPRKSQSNKDKSSLLTQQYLQVPLVYCDQTASNRPVRSIEDYIQNTCLPLYGNTHTNTSITGSQTTALVAEARQLVAEACNAKITGKASQDVVLFAGNGATSAVELLIDVLGLVHANKAADNNSDVNNRPVVFVGPYEHHSNLIPWRESGCEIVMVPEDVENCCVDLQALEKLLQQPAYTSTDRLKMGTFSAASNVTGKLSDTNAIAALLHKYGALAFFDYATGAPYLQMDMNPPAPSADSSDNISKDAIFFSSHKLFGGVGAPGVLVVKKHLVSQNNAPSRSGGGTVFYVTHEHHRFLSDRVERYEGGTPNITGIMRTGLALLLKRQTEEKYSHIANQSTQDLPKTLQGYELQTYDKVATYLKEYAPNLVMLGHDNVSSRLPIFAFLIRCGKRFLHYNYVCAILNDLFGIQSRGGCQCAGPYSQRLLGLTEIDAEGKAIPNSLNKQIEEALLKHKERAELLRPGYTRLSLPFKGLCAEEVDYVCKALVWMSKHGWKLMSQYRCNHRTGEWRHQSRQGRPLGKSTRVWLSHYEFGSRTVPGKNSNSTDDRDLKSVLSLSLSQADAVLEEAIRDANSVAKAAKMNEADVVLGNDDLEKLRWYMYPKESVQVLLEGVNEFTWLENDDLLGAINPLLQQKVLIVNKVDTLNVDEFVCVKRQKCSVFFRDGEHTGEAPLYEIYEAIDDGELSNDCEIFDSDEDRWLKHSDFNNREAVRKDDEAFENVTSVRLTGEAVDIRIDDNNDMELTKTSNQLDPVDITNEPSSRVLKKTIRDNQHWGAGTPVVVNTTSYVNNLMDTVEPSSLDNGLSKTSKKYKHHRPPAKLMRLVNQAVMQWNMLQDGDRLLLGLSGGKDSLSLLHCLLELRRKMPVKFELEVCTIDPMTPSFDPSPLIPYVESLGLKYHYIREDIVSKASSSGKDGEMVSSLCAYCARMKRGHLYACARRNNCNKLVLAQHLDDCAESFMMSIMHNGFLRTMKANYKIDAGDLSVIRPMVYCRESLMTEFAKSSNLPVINENCPACFEEPKERARVKKLLSREENLYPNFYDNIKRALLPLMHEESTEMLRCYAEEALARSRKQKEPRVGVSSKDGASNDSAQTGVLQEYDDAVLLLELMRRRMNRARNKNDFVSDQQTICSLQGGCTILE